jgi:hypothetical protein
MTVWYFEQLAGIPGWVFSSGGAPLVFDGGTEDVGVPVEVVEGAIPLPRRTHAALYGKVLPDGRPA